MFVRSALISLLVLILSNSAQANDQIIVTLPYKVTIQGKNSNRVNT